MSRFYPECRETDWAVSRVYLGIVLSTDDDDCSFTTNAELAKAVRIEPEIVRASVAYLNDMSIVWNLRSAETGLTHRTLVPSCSSMVDRIVERCLSEHTPTYGQCRGLVADEVCRIKAPQRYTIAEF